MFALPVRFGPLEVVDVVAAESIALLIEADLRAGDVCVRKFNERY